MLPPSPQDTVRVAVASMPSGVNEGASGRNRLLCDISGGVGTVAVKKKFAFHNRSTIIAQDDIHRFIYH